MNDKYAKEIVKELRLIRLELQNNNIEINESVMKEFSNLKEPTEKAGERVTIK